MPPTLNFPLPLTFGPRNTAAGVEAAAYAGSWVARAETFLATQFPNTKAMEYHDFNMFTAGGALLQCCLSLPGHYFTLTLNLSS